MHITDETLQRIARSRYCRGLPGYRGRGFRDRLRRSVLGDLDDDVLASTRSKVRDGHVRMDAVSAALLAHHGVNPAVAVIVGLIAGTAEFAEGSGQCVVTDRSVLAPLHMGRAGFWTSSRGVLDGLPPLPETACLAAEGRPLREIVSHPALDPLPLVVLAAGVGPGDTRIAVEDAGVADLAAYLPAVR